MNKDFMINAVHEYLEGKITRNDLSLSIKNKRTAVPFLLDNYCSYANLLLDGIEQTLSAIPEESYCDDELRYIIDVLEGRRAVQHNFVYVIPTQMIDSNLRKLIRITQEFLRNFEHGKTHPIKVRVRLTNGVLQYHDTASFFTQEDYDFCETIQNILSNDTHDTVIKSIAWNLLSIINRFIGGWENITTYFASSETIHDDILLEDMKRSIQALCGKRPIYVSLGGMIDHINTTIVL